MLHYSPERACIIIYAGVILHNIITKHRVPEIQDSDDEFSDNEGDDPPSNDELEDPNVIIPNINLFNAARAARLDYARRYFS